MSEMHRLQQHILRLLFTNPAQRYAQLKPAEVEGNLFMYHLRQLIKQGIVAKRADGLYELTPAGQVFADNHSLSTMVRRAQPRIVTLMAVRDSEGRYLFYRRHRQPLINLIGFQHGGVNLGEPVEQAAERAMLKKTGIKATMRHAGDGYITTYMDGQPVSEIFFHLFEATQWEGEAQSGPKAGDALWAKLEDLPRAEVIPSTYKLVELLNQHPAERFFVELSYDLDQDRVER